MLYKIELLFNFSIHTDNSFSFFSFTSLFKDEYKLPKGSVIDLSREQGNVLQVKSKWIGPWLIYPNKNKMDIYSE